MRLKNSIKSSQTKFERGDVARIMRALLEAAALEEDETDGGGLGVKRTPPQVTQKLNWLRYG